MSDCQYGEMMDCQYHRPTLIRPTTNLVTTKCICLLIIPCVAYPIEIHLIWPAVADWSMGQGPGTVSNVIHFCTFVKRIPE